MIRVGTSLLFDRRAGKAGSPTFNKALVDAWFMSGLSNNDKPSSIRGVKGNEIVLKNFAYALSSGFGKYEVDFNSWVKNTNAANFTNSDSVIHLTEILIGGMKFLQTSVDAVISSYKVKVEGITDDIALRYVSYDKEGVGTYTYLKTDGIYTLPISYKKYTGFVASVAGACDIIITQLPSAYEGALVFDGVDDIAYIENFDTLIGEEKIYTVIGNYTNISTKQALFFNLYNRHNTSTIHPFVRVSSQSPASININYTRAYTINFETGKLLYKDLLNVENMSFSLVDNNIPDIFSLNGFPNSKGLSNWAELSQVAYYYLGIYRGILTPEEIETEKERLNEEWLKRKTE